MIETNKGILVCVETNGKAQTDVSYIDKVLKTFYYISNDIKLTYFFLDSKTKYADTGKIKKIEVARNMFSSLEVVYCLDMDDYEINHETRILNNQIEKFCKNKGYKLVWFNENVEDVFLHKKLSSSREKQDVAKKVFKKGGLGKATKKSLSNSRLEKRTSNILLVFDGILERKKL